MSKAALIIDCDPGVDDAVALLLAFASPELDILAVTTVAGNVGPALTVRNARLIRQIAGREDVPVFAGCPRPMVREPIQAGDFHGDSGLGDLPLFEPSAPTAPGHGVQAIIDLIMARPAGVVTIVATGPLTNIAVAMIMEPAIIGRLARIVIMGGARSEGGNTTASAEYNILADPHAAHVVFTSGCETVVLGLDVTHQVRATPERTAAIAAIDSAPAQAVAELLAFSNAVERKLARGEGTPLHDPCTIAWILRSDLFETQPCVLRVETASPLTLGHTAVELRLSDPDAATCHWATRADADGIFDLLTERLSR